MSNICCDYDGYNLGQAKTFYRIMEDKIQLILRIQAACPKCKTAVVFNSESVGSLSSNGNLEADQAFGVKDAEEILKCG